MNGLSLVGAVLLLLGILSFVVPVPHRRDHSVKIGDAKFGVTTQSSDKVPPAVSIILLGAGVLVLVVGAKKS
jgi:hypothetical protein